MSTKPTTAAMRAAEKLADMYEHVQTQEQLARIVDRETGLPALIAACEDLVPRLEDGTNWQTEDDRTAAWLAAYILRVAISKARGA